MLPRLAMKWRWMPHFRRFGWYQLWVGSAAPRHLEKKGSLPEMFHYTLGLVFLGSISPDRE